jgi:hypothetical protein
VSARGQVDVWKSALVAMMLALGTWFGGTTWGYHSANVEFRLQVAEHERLINKVVSKVERIETASEDCRQSMGEVKTSVAELATAFKRYHRLQ